MGALNMPAMAAAAPHPTSQISCRLSMPNSFPKLEPMALPVKTIGASAPTEPPQPIVIPDAMTLDQQLDRKSTRLNSSHANISYAVFCLKKKKQSHTR